jgi:hypothetical protein
MSESRAALERRMAEKYWWFCNIGWGEPTLNDPRVIQGTATAQDIDQLIEEGMRRWPMKTVIPPLEAA